MPKPKLKTLLKHPFRKNRFISNRFLKGYHVGKHLGAGSFAKVFRATKNNAVFAVKMVNLKDTHPAVFDIETFLSEITEEAGIGPGLQESFTITKEAIGVIVMDLWDCTLDDYVAKYRLRTIPRLVSTIVNKQLKMLLELGFQHCDLHLGNILLKTDGKKITDVTISDFGLMKAVDAITDEDLDEISSLFDLPRRYLKADNIDSKLFARLKKDIKEGI